VQSRQDADSRGLREPGACACGLLKGERYAATVTRRCPRTAEAAGLLDARGARGAPVLAAAALAAVLALSGCQAASPIQTNIPYQPGDGVSVDLGDVQVRGLLVVAGAKGEVGTLSGMVLNKGTKPVKVTFAVAADAGATTAEIPAGEQTRLSGVEGTAPLTLPGIPAAPGDVMKVTVSTPAGGAPEISVPVLLPTGYYSTITPAPAVTSAH
jgi:hypothetical protein